MIINSRIARVVEEATPDQIFEAAVVAHFKKPLELLRAEVNALEDYELDQTWDEYDEIWQ